MSETYEDLLARLADERDDLVVLTAENRAVIRGLPERIGDRFVDVGIAEQTLVGMAAGLALRGRRPVIHALASFLVFRAYEFVRDDLGIPGLPVILVGGFPGLLSTGNGATHQAVEDVGLLRGIPGMGVFCPGGDAELRAALPVLLEHPGPVYVRYHDGPDPAPPLGDVQVGDSVVLGEGDEVAFFAYGPLLAEAVTASGRLRERGVGARVVNTRFLEPFDAETAARVLGESRLAVVVEDHLHRGGLGAILRETAYDRGIRTPIVHRDLGDTWFPPGPYGDLLVHLGLDAPSLERTALDRLEEMTRHA